MAKTYYRYAGYYCRLDPDEELCQITKPPDCNECEKYQKWKRSKLTIKEWNETKGG